MLVKAETTTDEPDPTLFRQIRDANPDETGEGLLGFQRLDSSHFANLLTARSDLTTSPL